MEFAGRLPQYDKLDPYVLREKITRLQRKIERMKKAAAPAREPLGAPGLATL